MATNDFLPFAADPAANVMLQTDYEAAGFTPRILGFQTGTALAIQLNKVWRQASLISAMIGQFTVDETGADMLDDGSTGGQATLLANFKNAVHAAGGAGLSGNYLPLAGGTLSGNLTINAGASQLIVAAVPGQAATMTFLRGPALLARWEARTNTLERWTLDLADNTPETGGNAGSNLVLGRYSDAGGYIDAPISISRQTGVVNFSQPPTVAGGYLPYVPIGGGRMTGILASPGIQYSFGGYAHQFQFYWDGGWSHIIVDGADTGQVATASWVQQIAGGYLPLGGGTLQNPGNLDIEGGLWVTGGAQFRSNVAFANLGDFANFQQGGNRFRQWASNWYDVWISSSGVRLWVCNSGPTMQLDGGANLTVSGNFHAYGGRIVAGDNGAFTAYGQGISGGFWASSGGLAFGWCDTTGGPTNQLALLGTDGVWTVWNGIVSYASIQASNQVTAGGRLYSADRLLIASGYPTNVSWNTAIGYAMGFVTSSYGPNGYGTAAVYFGNADGNGNIGGLVSTITNYGYFFVSGGIGTPSGRNIKSAIEQSTFDSLQAIRRIVHHSYKVDERDVPVGMIADEVQAVLPDVVIPGETTDYLDHMALISHAYKAIIQLASEVDALKRG